MKNALIVLVITALAGVGYFAFVKKDSQVAQQPTPTPTKTVQVTKSPTPTSTANPMAGWKTYTNSEFGYSLNYPSNWSLTAGSTSTGSISGNRLSILPPDPLSTQSVDEDFSILIRDASKESLNLATEREKMKHPNQYVTYNETTGTVGGVTAYFYVSNDVDAAPILLAH
ncbi:MAG TPA: PsbP-related protein, partial [Candidatus Paceibacterota bacterium]|nr:PsbP-related protein [Candidatus Paceibacterota bacterium]